MQGQSWSPEFKLVLEKATADMVEAHRKEATWLSEESY
jgi:hypothetical protein